MSEENVRLVATGVKAMNEGDIDGFIAVGDPECELESYLAGLSEGAVSYHGHEGFRRYARDMAETCEYFSVEVDEYRETGDTVAVLGQLRARGRTSGIEVERALAWVMTVANVKLTRVRVFTDTRKALEAAGLSE